MHKEHTAPSFNRQHHKLQTKIKYPKELQENFFSIWLDHAIKYFSAIVQVSYFHCCLLWNWRLISECARFFQS